MFPELTIGGAPFERGQAYGAAVAPLVRHSIASYARLFATRRGLDWADSQAEAMRFAPLLRAVLVHDRAGLDRARAEVAAVLALAAVTFTRRDA